MTTFTENGVVDAAELNALYEIVGWDSAKRRTTAETVEMLRASHYYIAAHTAQNKLIGFARVCGDPYVAQVLDVITHPDHRHRGVASSCMRGVLRHLQASRYVTVTLTANRELEGFYQQFGFEAFKNVTFAWKRAADTR